MPKIRNIIIFIAIGAVLVLVYIFYIKPSPNDTANLISSGGVPAVPAVSNTVTGNVNGTTTQDFLSLLLNVKSINLDDSIFSDNAFISLHDSSIVLTPDGTEGRPNPFAQFGNDVVVVVPLICTLPKVLDIPSNTCITPPSSSTKPTCVLPQILNNLTNTCVDSSSN